MSATSLFRFGDHELDLAAYEVRCAGVVRPVEPQVFELLAHLVRNPGRLVTRDELINQVWGGRAVSDAALSSRIKSARRALDDDGEQQRLIRTVHGRGFRFVGSLAPAAPIPAPAPAPSPTPAAACGGRPTIAVQPLRAASGGEAEQHLAQSLAEDVVACLARDRSLAVGTWCSHPRYLLEGCVRRAEERLLVTVRLSVTADGENIWAERCEQKLGAIDERLPPLIAAMVRGEIERAEAKRAALQAEPERDAWAHYHLGLKELYRFTPAGLAAARAHLERAIALEPEMASAWARLAYVHIQEYWYGAPEQRALVLEAAQTAAQHAIGLDQKNALGHFAAGRVHALRQQFGLAMPAFETAIRLNPGLAQAHFALGQSHLYADLPKHAVPLLDTAIQLDPDDPHFWCFLHDQSDAYYALGELDQAARRAQAASRYPNATHWPFASLASVLGTAGRIDEARETTIELRQRRPDYTLAVASAELAHFSNKGYVAQYLQGLKAAGVPDDREVAGL